MQFNEKLKELRAKKGVSQSELAESIYVSRSAVAKWENGLGLPSDESLRLLTEYFGVSTAELCSDAPTEKVIVQKNRIISRSRKLLVTISTVCAAAFTAIIVLAVVLGLNLTATEKDSDDDIVPSGEIPQVLYNLTVGEEYVLSVRPSPSGYNGHEFGIYEDYVNVEYDSDIFEVFRGIPEQHGAGVSVDYVLKIKQSCNMGLIKLYYGKEVTEKSNPAFLFVINAALQGEVDP